MFITDVIFSIVLHLVLSYIVVNSFTLRIPNHFVNYQCHILTKEC